MPRQSHYITGVMGLSVIITISLDSLVCGKMQYITMDVISASGGP